MFRYRLSKYRHDYVGYGSGYGSGYGDSYGGGGHYSSNSYSSYYDDNDDDDAKEEEEFPMWDEHTIGLVWEQDGNCVLTVVCRDIDEEEMCARYGIRLETDFAAAGDGEEARGESIEVGEGGGGKSPPI